MLKKRYFFWGAAGTAFVLASLLSFSCSERLPDGGNKVLPRIEKLFAGTKTVCYGGFLIDVPLEAEVIYGPSHLPWPLASYPGKGTQFEEVLAARMVEVVEEKKSATGRLRDPGSLVGTVIDGKMPGQKIVFGVSKVSSRIYRIDSYIRSKEDLFIQQADPTAAERDLVISELNAIASTLRSRGASEIPEQAGSCIEAGFVEGPRIDSFEMHSLGIRLAEFPDVHLSISVTKKSELIESDALEPRLRQAEESVMSTDGGGWFSRIKVLRRGSRSIGKWHGFEMLARKPSQEHEGESHEFLFVSQGEPKNPLLPLLDLELHTGVKGDETGGVRPSLTDDEVIAVWDKLTGSIRIRPTK